MGTKLFTISRVESIELKIANGAAMRSQTILFLTFFCFSTLGFAKDSAGEKFKLDGFYGMSSVSPGELNSYRTALLWNGTTSTNTSGKFDNLTYFGGLFGYKI